MNFLKSILLSILSGLLLGLAWPTYGITAFIFIAFIPLLHVAKYNNKFSIKIFLCFYLTFLIWNIIATSWLYYASLGGVLFAVLVNSLLMTIVFSLFFIVSKKINSKLSLIFLVSFWLCFEKFHLMWDFSWPWLNIGNVFSEKTEWIQWYEYTGSFGGTLWVLLTNILIYKVFLSTIYNEKPRLLIVSVILVIIVPITISKIILYNLDLEEEPIDVFIIQPNIDPYSEKYNRTDKDNYHYVHDLLEENSIKNSTIILPETFFSDGTQINGYSGNEFIKQLEFLKNKFNSEILTGIELFEIVKDSIKIKNYSNNLNDGRWLNLYNSSVFISDENQFYNKSKLVVGIEKMPYKKLIEPILGNLLMDFGGLTYSRGYDNERKNFKSFNNFYLSPIICYESVYGEYVTEYTRSGSKLFAIITNDGWWDVSEGHKQHLSYAKLRAIENRRNIVRSANTGVSAIINYRGEIEDSIEYGEEGFINTNVGLIEEKTFYVNYGDYIFRISLFFFIIIGLHFLATIVKIK